MSKLRLPLITRNGETRSCDLMWHYSIETDSIINSEARIVISNFPRRYTSEEMDEMIAIHNGNLLIGLDDRIYNEGIKG